MAFARILRMVSPYGGLRSPAGSGPCAVEGAASHAGDGLNRSADRQPLSLRVQPLLPERCFSAGICALTEPRS